MQAELRPLTLGEILDRTFQLYRAHFLTFVGISTLAAAVDLVWKLIQSGTVRAMQDHAGATSILIANSSFSVLALLVYVVASAVAIAAISRAVSAVYLGQPTGIARAYKEVKPHWFRYVLVYASAFILAWGLSIVVFLGFAISAGFAAAKMGSATSIGIMFALLGFSLLIFIPFGVWMMLRYSLANACSVFEDLGVRGALKRSVSLTLGHRGRIFVMFLLAGVLVMVLSYASAIPLIFDMFKHPGHISTFSTVVTLIANFMITSLTTPFYGIALTLFYYDTRIRKEGFDIDWMMQRAMGPDGGYTPAPAVPVHAEPSVWAIPLQQAVPAGAAAAAVPMRAEPSVWSIPVPAAETHAAATYPGAAEPFASEPAATEPAATEHAATEPAVAPVVEPRSEFNGL